MAAKADVGEYGNLPIPMKVRNAPTKLMKDLGYHKGYTMYDTESYLPDKLKERIYLSQLPHEKPEKPEEHQEHSGPKKGGKKKT